MKKLKYSTNMGTIDNQKKLYFRGGYLLAIGLIGNLISGELATHLSYFGTERVRVIIHLLSSGCFVAGFLLFTSFFISINKNSFNSDSREKIGNTIDNIDNSSSEPKLKPEMQEIKPGLEESET